MSVFTCFALLIIFFHEPTIAQKLPEGHILQYQQSFNHGNSLSDFMFDIPASWGIFSASGNYYLQCTGANNSVYATSLPANIAVISDKIFGDFVLEANVMPEADTNGFRETCLFLGMKDKNRYYYVQLASQCDSAHHGIYLVKNSVPSRLTGISEKAISWKDNKWHKLRLERNIVKRTILVFVDDMIHPVMQIKDYELVMGMVGLGSFTSPCRFDNIKIWAPTVISEE